MSVYRDIEKIYRLYALYSGRVQAMEPHVKLIDQSLAQHLRGKDADLDWMQFEFLMTAVQSQGENVFISKQPETTLSYALFCEGIRALLISKNISAREVLDWCTRIRKYFIEIEKPEGSLLDLASVLWKNPHPHLRVYLFNSLLELKEVDPAAEGLELKNETGGLLDKDDDDLNNTGNNSKDEWHSRDMDWELPSGDLVFSQMDAEEDLLKDKLTHLKQQLSDASINDRAERIMRFQEAEIEALKNEIETYDQNHVEFNLLVQFFTTLSESSDATSLGNALILENLKKMASSIISRFHGGLILFFLKRLQDYQTAKGSDQVTESLKKSLMEALAKPDHLRLLAEALTDASRYKIAKQLVVYLSRESQSHLLDFLIDQQNKAGIQHFLMMLIETDPTLDQDIFQWGDQRLIQVLPVLQTIPWSARSRFLIRCLRHRSLELNRAALPIIADLPIKSSEAMALYEKLSAHDRKILVDSFSNRPVLAEWAPFIQQVIRSGYWSLDNSDIALAWARAAFRYLGRRGFELLDPFVSSRKFILWPKFSVEREAALIAALQIKEPQLRAQVNQWAAREKGLFFQDSELKQKLAAAAR
ncbi:MAG: hypothetical protein J0L93_06205 [Deltaproteobacteria bacterium]|nr:hypothetical protein [Deltaproteobacteria bacterium]